MHGSRQNVPVMNLDLHIYCNALPELRRRNEKFLAHSSSLMLFLNTKRRQMQQPPLFLPELECSLLFTCARYSCPRSRSWCLQLCRLEANSVHTTRIFFKIRPPPPPLPLSPSLSLSLSYPSPIPSFSLPVNNKDNTEKEREII